MLEKFHTTFVIKLEKPRLFVKGGLVDEFICRPQVKKFQL